MAFVHHKWTQFGRELIDDQDPSLRAYVSRITEKNIDAGGGVFEPYQWDEPTASLKHGDCECDFLSTHQEIKQFEQVVVSKSRIFIQRETSPGVWDDVPHGGDPTRNIHHNTPEFGMCRAWLDFTNIQGNASGAEFQAGIEVGRGNKQRFGFRLVSPVAGNFRLEWVLDVPADVPMEWITVPTSYEDRTPLRIGGRIGDFDIRWSREEVPYRDVTIESDGSGGRIVRIMMGPYALSPGVPLWIYPDTWGPTGIASDADDCWQYNTEFYAFSDPIYLGSSSQSSHFGLRWQVTIPAGATFQDGCNVQLYHAAGDQGGGNCACDIYAWNTNNPGVFSLSNLPGNVPRTLNYASWTPAGQGTAGWKTTSELKAVVQEVFDSYGPFSSEGIALPFISTDPTSYMDFEDYSGAGNNEARLTLVYTIGTAQSGSTTVSGDGVVAANGSGARSTAAAVSDQAEASAAATSERSTAATVSAQSEASAAGASARSADTTVIGTAAAAVVGISGQIQVGSGSTIVSAVAEPDVHGAAWRSTIPAVDASAAVATVGQPNRYSAAVVDSEAIASLIGQSDRLGAATVSAIAEVAVVGTFATLGPIFDTTSISVTVQRTTESKSVQRTTNSLTVQRTTQSA